MSPQFHPFGLVHLAAVSVIASVITLACAWGRRVGLERAKRGGRALAIVLLAYYAIECVVRLQLGVQPIILLPLEICSILFFVGAYAYWSGSEPARDIVYFWTYAGTHHAMITPTPAEGFPSVELVRYFACHGLLILSAVYGVVALDWRPNLRSMVRAFLALQAWEIFVGVIDWASGQNFLYLRHPPPSPTLFDQLGPWPWYLLSLELVAALSFGFWLGAVSLYGRLITARATSRGAAPSAAA